MTKISTSKPQQLTIREGAVVVVKPETAETAPQSGARAMMDPTVIAAVLTPKIIGGSTPTTEAHHLIDEFRIQCRSISANDFTSAEQMLFSQAHTLSQLFNTMVLNALTSRDRGNMSSYELHMRLALKAQSQCRTTLESLFEIKNPRSVAFIRQANVATNQQVNNAHAQEKSKSQQNELLGVIHEQPLDARRAGKTSRGNSTVEAVGAGNWPADRGRKS